MRFLTQVALISPLLSCVSAFPGYQSLAGLSEREIEIFIRESQDPLVGGQPVPSPQNDTSSKLVNDAAHPYMAPGPNDIRGPCPGLNTLANHGYLNRSGIVTPQSIVNAVQEGFNMEYAFAVFVTWGAFLVDGNLLTNLMSIGEKSKSTGPDPPAPAIVGGLNTHGVFEGDASTTRGDFYFGDNHSFNETLFEQLVAASNQYGAGKYNQTVAAEVRWNRIQDSIARNPTFDFTVPRIFTAYAESIFPYRFFVDGRSTEAALDMTTARSFFQNATYPTDFYRRNGTFGFENSGDDFQALESAHPIDSGRNFGVNNYTLDPTDPGLEGGGCGIYHKHINQTLRSLYPNPKGQLRKALKEGIVVFYEAMGGNSSNCEQVFPYGK